MTTPQIIIVAVLVIVAAVAYRAVTRKPEATLSEDPNVFMPVLAEEAVKFAAGLGETLDYSPDSVERVEFVLGELHESRSAGELADGDLNRHAHQFGAYIGEVLRRKYGGHWTEDHEVAGPKSFPIHWKDGQSFPVGWCGKRLLNGDEDNVWHKYQVVTSDEYRSGAMTQPSDGGAAAMEGSNQTIQVGGIYATPNEDGSWNVVRVLALDEYAVHLRFYSDRFAEQPKDVDLANLKLSIGHAPLARGGFENEERVLIKVVPVAEDELEGYRYYLEAMDGGPAGR